LYLKITPYKFEKFTILSKISENEKGMNYKLMNLKKYINQIYELRLIQSTKAFISFFEEIKTVLPKDVTENFDRDKQLIENLYNKLMAGKRMLTDKEIDKLLSIYLIYSYSVNQIYQSKTKCSNIGKYSIYLIVTSCIYKYYQIEYDIYESLNIPKNVMVQDLMDACLTIRNLLMGLINYEQYINSELSSQKEIEKIKVLNNRFKDIKKEDIQSIKQDIEIFTNDCLNEVLYPVKYEYDRQLAYIQKKNEMSMSGYENNLKDILLYLKKYKSSDLDN